MRNKAIAVLVVVTTLLLSGITIVEAVPPLPSSFHGTVRWSIGINVSPGIVVSAWINGVKYAETPVQTYLGNSVYALNVPGDDPDTPEVEGGVEGNTVVFKVRDSIADQTGTWHSGTDVELNLTAPPTVVTLSSFTAKSGAVMLTDLVSRSLWALVAVTGLMLIGVGALSARNRSFMPSRSA